jgi:uncharacterized SAM-binding protein YcdF (DUF218 family)
VWLWGWSTPVWSDYIRNSLESAYPYQFPRSYPTADAIVVLGGGVRGYAGPQFPNIDLNRASDRELFAAQLYRAGRARKIILSGGADPIRRTGAQASAMKIFLINLGVPARDIYLGTQSRNTVENRAEVEEIVKKSGGQSILLVTSALHMKRSFWLFSRTTLKVTPAPSDFEVVPAPFTLYRLIPDAEALENSTRAAREILGLWAYRMELL